MGHLGDGGDSGNDCFLEEWRQSRAQGQMCVFSEGTGVLKAQVSC